MQNGPGGRRGRFRAATNSSVNTRIGKPIDNVHKLFNAIVTTVLLIMQSISALSSMSLDTNYLLINIKHGLYDRCKYQFGSQLLRAFILSLKIR